MPSSSATPFSRICQCRETEKVGCRGPVHGPKVVAASWRHTHRVHPYISDGGLGIPSLRWFAPMLRLKRLDRIIFSNNIYDGYLNHELAVARAQTACDDLNLTSAGSIRGMWAEKLHRSVDGTGLKEACRVKSANTFVGDGSRLLSGRDFVHIAQTRINAIYSRSRTTRGRHRMRRECRAGYGMTET